MEEVHQGRDDIKKIASAVGKLEDSFKKFCEELKDQNEAAICIETSTYKVYA